MICIFCFYSQSSGVQAKLAFDKQFKHCNVICYDGECFLATDFDSFGIQSRIVHAPSTTSLIRGMKCVDVLIAMVVVQIHERASIRWKPFLVRSCNEINRYVSGVNVGFTFNPKHLYNKLLRRDGMGYEVLSHWRRDGIIWGKKRGL